MTLNLLLCAYAIMVEVVELLVFKKHENVT